jgi:hypothetical protein
MRPFEGICPVLLTPCADGAVDQAVESAQGRDAR